ncbi:MAG: iron-sulfur binding hydrogenase [Thermotogota bacterium]
MNLNTIIDNLDLEIINKGNLDTEIEKGHIGDLLSEVMRNAEEKCIWITHQTHQNVIAVAEVVGANAILIPEGLNYLPETLEKAKNMDINLLKTNMSGFEVTGKIYNLLKK